MNTPIIIFEDAGWRDLLPLTYARAVFDLRCGLYDLRTRIMRTMQCSAARLFARKPIADLLNSPGNAASTPLLLINGRLLLNRRIDMPPGSACWHDDVLVAAHLPAECSASLSNELFLDAARLRGLLASQAAVPIQPEWGKLIRYPWDLIAHNAGQLRADIDALPRGGTPPDHPGAHFVNPAAIRIGKAAVIKPGAVLDAEEGPIHVGDNVTILPNAVLRGPCSVGDKCVVQAGAFIREGTSIGPVCKVGGEIEGSIFQGYANKQHDGFLGHSYIGEWVNLGADTVTSDLKNTYGTIQVPLHGTPLDTGLQFVGSIIGDHSKTGICTALTTGSVIGFCCNVAVPRPPRFVPSFSWLTESGRQVYDVERALAVARKVMSRRKIDVSASYETVFRAIPSQAASIERA